MENKVPTNAPAKAMTLSQFLAENPVNELTAEVFVSERFRKAGFPFKIRAMSGKEFGAYQRQATVVGRHKKVNFDTQLFNEQVILNHCIVPNFKDIEAIKAVGCSSPEEFLYSRLLAGEITELSQQISILSGFDSDHESLVDEVKNS